LRYTRGRFSGLVFLSSLFQGRGNSNPHHWLDKDFRTKNREVVGMPHDSAVDL
jgi:hypothetical protein